MPIKIKLFGENSKVFSKTFFDQCIVSFGNFFSNFLLIKFLGLNKYGIFSEIWILIISFNIIQNAFVISPLLSVTAKLSPHKKVNYINNVYLIQIIFSLIVSIITFLILTIWGYNLAFYSNNNLAILTIISSIFLIQIYEFIRRAIYVSSEIFNLLIFDFWRYSLQILFLLFTLSRGLNSPENILFIYGSACMISIFLNKKNIPKVLFKINTLKKTLQRNWEISRWLISNSIISWFQSNYLLFLTSFTIGPLSLGIIRTFQSILGVNNIFLQSIDTWLPVKSAELFRNKPAQDFKKFIFNIILIFYIISILIFIILLIFSNLILLIYDKTLINYIISFRLFCLSYLLVALNFPVKSILLGIEKTFSNFYSSLISIFLILALGPFLIKDYGINGVIFSYIISQFVILIINTFYLWKNCLKNQ